MTRPIKGPSNPPSPPKSMAYEIFPQSKTLYPADSQFFRVRIGTSPILWQSVTNGTIQPNDSINFTTSGQAQLVQLLHSGIGTATFTFDSLMIPNTGGRIVVFFGGAGPSINAEIGPTTTVVKDEDNNTVATVGHTVVAADTYTFEAAGSALRMYINGQKSAEYLPTDDIEYPFFLTIFWFTPFVSGGPHIAPPLLKGDWRVEPGDQAENVWTEAGGQIDDDTNVWQVFYQADDAPGEYTLSVRIASSVNQDASTTIFIPPLAVIGPTTVTIQPGEVVRFKTNYDAAQHDLVTWAANGGTFDAAHNWTAPTTPGDYVVTAQYQTQIARIFVTIPAVITPKLAAALPGEVINFDTNITSPTFSASAGSINSSSGIWTAPSIIGQEVTITATGGGFTATLELIVLEAFPYQPNFSIPVQAKKKVLIAEAEDGRRATRVKNYQNRYRRSLGLLFKNRDMPEVREALAFWNQYYPSALFIYDAKIEDERMVVYMDSDFDYEIGNEGSCDIDYRFRITEN